MCKKGVDIRGIVSIIVNVLEMPSSSSGLGHRPLTAAAGVRLPYWVPSTSLEVLFPFIYHVLVSWQYPLIPTIDIEPKLQA